MVASIAVLGPIEVRDGGDRIDLPRGHPRRILASLVSQAPRPVTTDTLVHQLWGDDAPPTARTALQVHVSKLRRHLGTALELRTVDGGYRLEIAEEQVDARRLERAVAEARLLLGAEPRRAAALIGEALSLWRGAPYGDVGDAAWLEQEVARLGELRDEGVELWADAELASGRHASVVDRLRVAVDDQPLRERRWAQLMLALYRSGRQADALREYQRASRMLVEELGVEPGAELRGLERRILLQDPALGADGGRTRGATNLPLPSTTLLGRSAELHRIGELLSANRLVTLTGPAGVGKTRLAAEVARTSANGNRDGVWFVALGSVSGPALVTSSIALGLGITSPTEHGPTDPLDLLRSHIRGREVLLVVDGCEHVAAEVAGCVQVLLAAAPGLTVLATSRQGLGLPAEVRQPVAPLAVGDADSTDEMLARSPAVRLFLERSDAPASPGSSELRSVADVCRHLDGLPLAIELVAAMSRGLAVSDVLGRLRRRREGVAGRFESPVELRAALDWSHDLLSADDRVVLHRLSVFSSGFTFDEAEHVAGGQVGPDAVGGSLSRLVQASLVSVDAQATPARYRLSTAVRAYAACRLEADGDTEATQRLLAMCLGERARAVRPGWVGKVDYSLLVELDDDHDNCRSLLQTLLDRGDTALALDLAMAFQEFWYERGFWAEGAAWLRTALASAEVAGGLPAISRARAILCMARTESTFAGVASHLDALREISGVVADDAGAIPTDRYAAALLRGLASGYQGFPDEAAEQLAVARRMAASLDDGYGRRWAATVVDSFDTLRLAMLGDVAAARDGQHVAAARFIELGDPGMAGRTLMYAGMLGRMMGDDPGARDDFARSIELCVRSGSRATSTHSYLALAVAAAELGDPEAPALLHQAREEMDRTGDVRCRAVAERTLGEIALEADEPDEALAWFRGTLPVFAAQDLRSLAVTLADVADVYLRRGRGEDAVTLATAAQHFSTGLGIPLSTSEAARIATVTARLGIGGPAPDAPAPDLGALLHLADPDVDRGAALVG